MSFDQWKWCDVSSMSPSTVCLHVMASSAQCGIHQSGIMAKYFTVQGDRSRVIALQSSISGWFDKKIAQLHSRFFRFAYKKQLDCCAC